jgi:hypothetical protein
MVARFEFGRRKGKAARQQRPDAHQWVAFSSKNHPAGKGQSGGGHRLLAAMLASSRQPACAQFQESAIQPRRLYDTVCGQGGTVMLISLIALTALLVSWLSAGSNPVAGANDNPLITPQDPSTLTLGLIGAGTLAVYFSVSRRIRRGRRQVTMTTGRLSDQSIGAIGTMPVEPEEQRPTRGAA